MKPASILIVDDVPENRQVLSFILKHQGYLPRTVTNGEEALAEARANPPDLILLDIMMPVLNGFETCRKLKNDDSTRPIPVIFITALGDAQDKIEAFRAGGVDYITKPFDPDEVIARLETHLAIQQLKTKLEETNQELALRVDQLRKSEEAEREQRVFAEKLGETFVILNQTLESEKVLDQVLPCLQSLVPHEAAALILMDEQDFPRVQRSRGYESLGPQEFVLPTDSSSSHPEPDLVFYAGADGKTNCLCRPARSWASSSVSIPIRINQNVIGVLILDSARPGQFTGIWRQRIELFTEQVASALQKASLYAAIQQLAITDVLTGVYNRRKLFELAEHEFTRSLRYNRPLSLVMLDIDHFKSFNDTYGHQVGDAILTAIAQHFRKTIRSTDVFGRYGGEEFMIVLPETGLGDALLIAERFRKEVAEMRIQSNGLEVGVTVSLGAVGLEPKRDRTLDMLVQRVDACLYEAKGGGRNRVFG